MASGVMSPRRLEAIERENAAYKLRRDGLTFEVIGQKLGCDTSYAWRLVKRAFIRNQKTTSDEVAYNQALDLDRCDVAIVGLMPGVESGKPRSVEAMLGVLKRRADLLGLDKPQKVAPTTPDGSEPYDGLSDTALVGALNRLAQAARARAGEAVGGDSALPLGANGQGEPAAT